MLWIILLFYDRFPWFGHSETAELSFQEPCFGRLRGLYREAKAKYVYCEDYRDPEPPEFDESTLKKIFFPKVNILNYAL